MSIQWHDRDDPNVPTFDMPAWLRRVLRTPRGREYGGRGVVASDNRAK